MIYTTTLTKKGQLTIPQAVREKLNLRQGSKVTVELREEEKEIKLRPAFDILDLAGKLKSRRKTSPLKAREFFEKFYQRA